METRKTREKWEPELFLVTEVLWTWENNNKHNIFWISSQPECDPEGTERKEALQGCFFGLL
jgi:hypothetical protein